MRRTLTLGARLRVLAAALGVLFAGAAQAQDTGNPRRPLVDRSPAQVLSWMASAVRLESELGELAHKHGASAEVRRYGQILEGDARVEAAQLRRVAHGRGIPLGEPEPLPLEVRA